MDFSVIWIDAADLRAKFPPNETPAVAIQRPQAGGGNRPRNAGIYGTASVGREGEFWVPANPLNDPDGEIKWSVTSQGEIVRIPVFAYITPQQAKPLLAACGMEMGVRAGLAIGRRCHKEPLSVTMVLGHQCEPAGEGYRYYLGVAVRVS